MICVSSKSVETVLSLLLLAVGAMELALYRHHCATTLHRWRHRCHIALLGQRDGDDHSLPDYFRVVRGRGPEKSRSLRSGDVTSGSARGASTRRAPGDYISRNLRWNGRYRCICSNVICDAPLDLRKRSARAGRDAYLLHSIEDIMDFMRCGETSLSPSLASPSPIPYSHTPFRRMWRNTSCRERLQSAERMAYTKSST